jgi:amino acid efflux transporter
MSGLVKSLGVTRGTALMLNIVLGAGLLTLPGLAFRDAGGSAQWVWAGCALVAIPLLAVFAMIGRTFPDAGGIPAVAGRQFGPKGYTAGTFLFLGAVALGLPGIAITGGYYAATFIDASPYLLGGIIVVLATLVNFLSAELAGKVNEAIASTLVVILLIIIALGGYAVSDVPETANAISPSIEIGPTRYVSVFMMVFFAFTGWEVAAHLSEEFRNPKRDIPLAMAFSFLLALAFYIALALIVSLSGLTGSYEAPFVVILSKSYGGWAGHSMALVAVVMIFANLSAAIWAVSRMVFSSAREGLLPAALKETRNGTPIRAVFTVLCVLIAAIVFAAAGILPLSRLLEFAGQNFLILYGFAAVALFSASTNIGIRMVAALATLIVLGLLAMREPWAMVYPLGLILLSLGASRLVARGTLDLQRAQTKV